MILLIDNYDSFTYNLAHLFAELGAEVCVAGTTSWTPTRQSGLAVHLVVSPVRAGLVDSGATARDHPPARAARADARRLPRPPGDRRGLRRRDRRRPLARARQGGLDQARRVGIFRGLPDGFEAGRYHSLAATSVPEELEVSATSGDGEVMAAGTASCGSTACSFHPESVLTPSGSALAGATFSRRRHDSGSARTDSRRQRPRSRRGRAVMDEIMRGEATPGRSAASWSRSGSRARPPTRSRAAPRRCASTCWPFGRSGTTWSTPRGPAATEPGRSTSRRQRRSSRRPEPGSRSTGTARSPSSSGSADVLEALGFDLELPPERIARSIDELGFGFLFAPTHHPAMRHAAPVRRELGARTVFNVLGPLTNPAGARAQVVGVYAPELVPTIARVLAHLGARRAFVVHGAGGIDELSPAGPNLVCEVTGGRVRKREIDPLELGIPRCDPGDLRGGSPTRTRLGSGRSSAAGTAAPGTRCCSTRPGRSRPPGTRRTSARGLGTPGKRSTPGRRRGGSRS